MAYSLLLKLGHSNIIDSEIEKLRSSLSCIEAVLLDASRKEITSESVKWWLKCNQLLANKINDVLKDLAIEGDKTNKVTKLILTCFTGSPLSSGMKGKLKDINIELQDLAQKASMIRLIGTDDMMSKNIIVNRRYQTSLLLDKDRFSIVGLENDKKTLIKKLIEPSNKTFSIVPIVGMEGVGKTTLARLLFNDYTVKPYFDVMVWICVSDVFDVFNITKAIYESVTKEYKEFTDLYLLQLALREKLNRKYFLIVLDDVRSESFFDWQTFEAPFHELGGRGRSKIIMTTRKMTLLNKLGYSEGYCPSILSHDDALTLFSKYALGMDNFDSHPTLKPYAEGIMKKCDGLPKARGGATRA